MAKRNIGSDFDDFLEEEGLLEEATATAVKRYIAYQLAVVMEERNLSKTEMARRMETSRSALDRLLDPENSSVTLQTLQSAVQALGGRLKIELEFHRNAA
jgi:DNA-binding phage protein